METPQEPSLPSGVDRSGRPREACIHFTSVYAYSPAKSEGTMGTQPIDYEAVIADLESKKAHIETMIAGMRVIAGMGGLGGPTAPSNPTGGGSIVNGKPAPDAFLGKSIPEAAKMYLTSMRRKLSTQELMEAMEAGGLPGSKYATVYAILSRRESKVGDIVNIKGDWALAEWYPNYVRKSPKKGVVAEEGQMQGDQADEEEPIIEPAGEIRTA
jgi:hypothetical protein